MGTSILDAEYDKLLKNSLWHLCRSNTENAISNFWAYLIQTTGNTSIILGEKFNKNIEEKNILREKFHTDLLLNLKKEIVVIENKVKSLPNDKQIEKYAKTLKDKKEYNNKQIFYLITPIKITPINTEKNKSNNNLEIRYLTYNDVCKNITNYVDKVNFNDKTIINNFIEIMDSISKITSKLKGNYELLGYWEDTKSKDIIQQMREDKTYSLIKYANDNFCKTLEGNILKKIKADISEVDFGSAGPLISFKFQSKSNKDRLQGIQIQNKQFKYFIEGPGSISDEEIKQFAKKHKPEGFDFAGKKEKTCKYTIKNGVFKYKYVKIKNKEDLIKLLNFFAKHIKITQGIESK